MKRYEVKYTGEVLRVPAELLGHLPEATGEELKTLLLLAASDGVLPDPAAAGLTAEEFEGALAFLRGAGLIRTAKRMPGAEKKEEKAEDGGGKVPRESSSGRTPNTLRTEETPEYTGAEIHELLRRDKLLGSLIDACQRTLGKTFNPTESNAVIAMHETLGLDGEYILLLLAHCAERDKKNVTYALRMASGLVERGILTPPQLEAEFSREAALHSAEGMLRRLFGIGERALTKKETEIFTRWTSERCHTEELIREAYELTVRKIGKASIPYCDTILEDWYAKGIRTAEEARGAGQEKKKNVRGSFDTDDFFEAALKRSMANAGGDR